MKLIFVTLILQLVSVDSSTCTNVANWKDSGKPKARTNLRSSCGSLQDRTFAGKDGCIQAKFNLNGYETNFVCVYGITGRW